ncbi:helix-turn-helix transcriptional regulator [Cupriavidus sp. H18C2]|uniref:helix-turn-helix transcriptional regulator n=1 Tax=Cupriavidus sp. H18C2 TaxID=3241602 RepID=UPI003BF8361B
MTPKLAPCNLTWSHTEMRNTQTLGLETYLRITQLINERFVPFSKPTLWRRVQDGSFPKPIRIQGVTAWRLSDIQEWQRAQLEAASAQ